MLALTHALPHALPLAVLLTASLAFEAVAWSTSDPVDGHRYWLMGRACAWACLPALAWLFLNF